MTDSAPEIELKRLLHHFVECAVAAFVLKFFFNLPYLPFVLLAWVSFVTIGGLLAPTWFGTYFAKRQRLGDLIGRWVTVVILTAIFFLVLVPIAFVLRLFGRFRSMKSESDQRTTYWLDRSSEPTEPERYFRQY